MEYFKIKVTQSSDSIPFTGGGGVNIFADIERILGYRQIYNI